MLFKNKCQSEDVYKFQSQFLLLKLKRTMYLFHIFRRDDAVNIIVEYIYQCIIVAYRARFRIIFHPQDIKPSMEWSVLNLSILPKHSISEIFIFNTVYIYVHYEYEFRTRRADLVEKL